MKKGWEYKKLGEVCDIVGGGTPNTKIKEYWNGNIPWATVSDMNCDELQSTGYYITDRGLKESSSRIIKRGEIIIATRVGLGKVCKLSIDTAINQDLKGVIPKNESIIRNFIFYYFKHKARYIADNGIGATVKGVKIKFIEGLLFGYPPLSEQQSIVDYLDSAFAKIDAMKANAEKALNEAKALFQASLKEMLEPKEGWEEKYLKDIAEYSIGLTYKPTNVCNDGTIVLRSSNIQKGKLDLNDIVRVNTSIKEELYVRYGDILMCSRNGSARLVGKVCIIPELKEKMTYGTFMMVIRSAYNPLLYHFFDTGLFRRQIKHGEATMINQITRYMLDEVKINLPPITKQQSIVTTLDSLKSKVDRLQANYEKISQECDALKQAILRQVFE